MLCPAHRSKSPRHARKTAAARSPIQTCRERYQKHHKQYAGGRCALDPLKTTRCKQQSQNKWRLYNKVQIFFFIIIIIECENKRQAQIYKTIHKSIVRSERFITADKPEENANKHRPLRMDHHCGNTQTPPPPPPPSNAKQENKIKET